MVGWEGPAVGPAPQWKFKPMSTASTHKGLFPPLPKQFVRFMSPSPRSLHTNETYVCKTCKRRHWLYPTQTGSKSNIFYAHWKRRDPATRQHVVWADAWYQNPNKDNRFM